jgi:hypothetical protein
MYLHHYSSSLFLHHIVGVQYLRAGPCHRELLHATQIIYNHKLTCPRLVRVVCRAICRAAYVAVCMCVSVLLPAVDKRRHVLEHQSVPRRIKQSYNPVVSSSCGSARDDG